MPNSTHWTGGGTAGCPDLDEFYYDLDAQTSGNSGVLVVQDSNFIRAPGYAAVWLGTTSSVLYSTFAYYNPLGTGSEANRSTAMVIGGSSSVSNYDGAWYNTAYYSGQGALQLQGAGQSGSGQYVYGNTFEINRYEMPDTVTGGQLVINSAASNAAVASNLINGGYWVNPGTGTVGYFGCSPGPTQAEGTAGIEIVGGNGHAFYNNSIIQHAVNTTGDPYGGQGMAVFGVNGIDVYGSYNPWNSSDTAKNIEDNEWIGIQFFDSSPSSSVTLHGIRNFYNGTSGMTTSAHYAGVYWGSGTGGTGFNTDAVDMCFNGPPPSGPYKDYYNNSSSIVYISPQSYQSTCP
ncbi:MAG: hypothetical protein JO062_28090 [Bryobacterales bacterium]|nr:hypothetical protein [Bryobacterales bacterium]